jgi:transglutaminase-like putative cysteine protease
MQKYLEATDIIDYHDENIQTLAKKLSLGTSDDEAIAKSCYEWVRDNIHHSGDYKDDITTVTASEVLKYGTGWCYAKAHLLAALLRANSISTGFCYQRLSCSEYKPDIYCLHGLNWIYIKKYGWYKVDVRGNKEGVDAQFTPPHEQLAFALGEHEFDMNDNLAEPLDVVVEALKKYKSYEEMICHFPDIKKEIV